MYYLKKYGQHFLKNKQILKQIVDIVPIYNKHVVEIGGGTGNLSEYIAEKKPATFEIIEIDNILYENLKTRFPKVTNANCLEIKINTQIIMSNLPYNIASSFIFHCTQHNNYEELILMVQKEMAEDWIGQKSFVSIFLHYFHEIKMCFIVSPESFSPKPKVYSAVVYLKKIRDFNFKIFQISPAFQHKKKKMINSIKTICPEEFLHKRPGELSITNWINIINNL